MPKRKIFTLFIVLVISSFRFIENMRSYWFRRFSIVAVLCLLVIGYLSTTFVPPVLAVPTFALPGNPATSISPSSDASLPSKLINILITPMLSLIGFFAVFYIVLAGWKFVRSNGDPKGAEEAKARLTFAIVGLVIVILAIALTQLVDRLILGGTGIF